MRPGLIAIRNINVSIIACEHLRSPHAIVATTNTVVSSSSRNKQTNNETLYPKHKKVFFLCKRNSLPRCKHMPKFLGTRAEPNTKLNWKNKKRTVKNSIISYNFIIITCYKR